MTVIERTNQYVSPEGWRLTLPAGWTTMRTTDAEPLNTNRPLVFFDTTDTNKTNPPAITWMKSDRPVSSEAWLQFSTATMLSGAIGSREAEDTTTGLFPLAGKVVEANVLRLPDGNKALELIEEICDTDSGAVTSQGYQLIFSAKNDQPGPLLMQRLVSYAPPETFKRLLPTIRSTARSFEYLAT